MASAARARVLAGSIGLVLMTSCSGGPDGLVLDGRPFQPDVSGVVEDVSVSEIVIDGETYPLGDELTVFSAASLETVPLAGQTGRYVQLALSGQSVEWVATVGAVLTDRGVVLFEDDVSEFESGVLTFASGYSVAVADGVSIPDSGRLLVFIDPETDEVVEVERR